MPNFQLIDPRASYTIRESAALKGLSYPRLRQAVTNGELPARREGRQFLISGRALMAWSPGDAPRVGRPSKRRAQPAAPDARIVTPRQAGEIKGVALPTIYLAITSGRLPARRAGGRWQINIEDLVVWSPGYSTRRTHVAADERPGR